MLSFERFSAFLCGPDLHVWLLFFAAFDGPLRRGTASAARN
jgi:hypothetical protein